MPWIPYYIMGQSMGQLSERLVFWILEGGCVCVSITNIIQQMAFRKSLPIYSCFKCGFFSHCCTLVAPLFPSKGLRRLRCVES